VAEQLVVDNFTAASSAVLRGGSTNLLTYSEQFNDAAWAKGTASITANAIVAPDGTLTGDKFIPNSGETGGAGTVVQALSKSATATTYTLTGYAKAGEFSSVRLYLNQQGNTGNRCEATYNVSTGATSSIINVGTFTGASASMVLVGNGWYRCVLTATTSTETSIQFRFVNAVSGQNGDGTSGIFIWGAQLNVGSTPAEYLQTVATAVTTAYAAPIESPNGLAFPLLATMTPARNADMTFELASNTSLVVKVRGSDGTVRSATLTLA
jgi:hypothetical protein